MDLGAAVDKLYGLPRERFVAERDNLAKAEPALAERIRKLRKPTVAVWQANQLARKRRKDVAALVGLGKDMRAAQENLDGEALRRLSRQRTEALDKLVARLPDAAAGLRDLLERASTDPGAAEDLLAGRLTAEPAGSGWGFELAMPTATVSAPEDDRLRRKYDEAKAADDEAQQALDAAEQELDAATRRVEELQAALTDARAARDDADAAVKRARQEAQRTAKRAHEAERRLNTG
jgi:hypothetical protein